MGNAEMRVLLQNAAPLRRPKHFRNKLGRHRLTILVNQCETPRGGTAPAVLHRFALIFRLLLGGVRGEVRVALRLAQFYSYDSKVSAPPAADFRMRQT